MKNKLFKKTLNFMMLISLVFSSNFLVKISAESECLASQSEEPASTLTKQTITRGKFSFDNVVCTEHFEIYPEEKLNGKYFKRDVMVKKTFLKIDKNGNQKPEIECIKKFTFKYNKNNYVGLNTSSNEKESIETEKPNRKKSSWGVADISKIHRSKGICLVSNQYSLYEKPNTDLGYMKFIQDSHTDIFCSVYGEIGINSDIQ